MDTPMPVPFYSRHIFVCINDKNGNPKCCGSKGSDTLRSHMVNRIKDLGLLGYGKIRVTRAGCMARCLSGPSLVIYPDNVWYSPKEIADIDEIIDEHILNDRLVERLLMGPTEVEVKD